MSSKKWNDVEIAEIKIMKKTMTIREIAEKKGLRVPQVTYALYAYSKKGKIKSMAEVRKRFDERENAPGHTKKTRLSIQETWAKQKALEQPKKKSFWRWLVG